MSATKEALVYADNTQPNVTTWSMIFSISAAFIVGTIILTTVGFASPELLHNAAHDIRHSLAFPCH